MPRNDTGLEKLSESPVAVVALNDGTVASRLSVASAVLPPRMNCSIGITSTGTGESVMDRGCCRRDPTTTTSSSAVKPSSSADAPGTESAEVKMLANTMRHTKYLLRMVATPRLQHRWRKLDHKKFANQCKRKPTVQHSEQIASDTCLSARMCVTTRATNLRRADPSPSTFLSLAGRLFSVSGSSLPSHPHPLTRLLQYRSISSLLEPQEKLLFLLPFNDA